MTRFARASGSKGSNEKKPEDGTSWQEMKASMLSKTDKNDKEDVKKENEDDDDEVEVPSAEEIKNVWTQLVDEAETSSVKKKKKVKKEKPVASEQSNETKKPKKKRKIETEEESPVKKKKKVKTEKDVGVKDKNKNKFISDTEPTTKDEQVEPQNGIKVPPVVNVVKEKKRRKDALKPAELMINGKPVKVAPFDGFIIQAEDADRLKELRKSMKLKGIPDDEREKAIKLERRRAEKALARLRKKVCFQCRSTGHNLSECPLIGEDQRATGICYKCGSTEHTHFQCKVTRGNDFKFAECFICKEQGHIAKQCPDNPRGLYPRGGGCGTCGDVTHLKKDCPKYLAEKEDDAVTVNTRNDRSLEALEEDVQVKKSTPFRGKKLNKHIKF